MYRCEKNNGKILVYDSIKYIVSREYDNVWIVWTYPSTKPEIRNGNIFMVEADNKWGLFGANLNVTTKKGTYKGLLNTYTCEELTKIIYDDITFNTDDNIITLKIKESYNPKTHYYHINTGELNDKYW